QNYSLVKRGRARHRLAMTSKPIVPLATPIFLFFVACGGAVSAQDGAPLAAAAAPPDHHPAPVTAGERLAGAASGAPAGGPIAVDSNTLRVDVNVSVDTRANVPTRQASAALGVSVYDPSGDFVRDAVVRVGPLGRPSALAF